MAEETLPPNWTQHQSKSHSEKVYYFNNATGETSWTLPKNKSKSQKRKQSRGQTLLDSGNDPGVTIQKSKNPAQSRLNTLQKRLLDKQKAEETRIKMRNKKVQKVDTSMFKAKNSKQKTEAGTSEKTQVTNAKLVKSPKNGKRGSAGTSQQVLKPGTSSMDAKTAEYKSLTDIMKERAKVISLFAVAENIRNRAMLREQAKAASKRKGKTVKEPPKKEEKPKATKNQEPKVVEKQETKSKLARKRTKSAKATAENRKCETIVRPNPVTSEKPKDLPDTAQKVDKNLKIGKVSTTITEVPLISAQDKGLPSLARPGIKRMSETNKIETNRVETVTGNRNIKRNDGSQVLDVNFAGNWIQERKKPLGTKENQANESRVKEDLNDGAPKCKIKKTMPVEDSSSATLFGRDRDSSFSQVFRSKGFNGSAIKDEPLVFSLNEEPEVVKPNSTFPNNNIDAFKTFRSDKDSRNSGISSNAFNGLWTNNQTSIFSSNKEPDVAIKSDTIPKASICPFSSTNISYNFTSGSKPFSANERLANIRRNLALSQNAVKPQNTSFSSFLNCSTASSSNDDITPMEWEDIDPDEEMQPVTRNQNVMEISTPLIEEFPRFSDFYDTVKKNLLKLSSEASSKTKEINKEDIFIVIDTNVFIHHLNFLKDLIEKSFVRPNIISVVPYSVLQELDKLKHRSDESLSTLAIRAIKFLNDHFESKNSSVRGQSALDSKMHLIDVESADDSIINCCLQFKRKTANVVLVSNDRNLRNKAICNGISTCTQENLLSRENNNFLRS